MMESKKTSGCCGGGCDCSSPAAEKKTLNIDFLYLDLSVCERCQGTESSLDEAIRAVSAVLNAAGYEISTNKVNITSKDLAIQYEFVSSPTIRINGNDIAMDVNESACKECGDLCGDSVDCRVWNYEGVEYTEPPKELIINAILKEVYSTDAPKSSEKDSYVLPQNLEVFFAGKK